MLRKLCAGHILRAQTRKVRRVLLAINARRAAASAHGYQGGQCNFGSPRFQRKHRFAKYRLADRHAVQPADASPVLPCFDTVRSACMVQRYVRVLHVRAYPGAVLTTACDAGAGLDDTGEVVIDPNFTSRIDTKFFQTLRQ